MGALVKGQSVEPQMDNVIKIKKNSFFKNQDNARLFLRPHKVFVLKRLLKRYETFVEENCSNKALTVRTLNECILNKNRRCVTMLLL